MEEESIWGKIKKRASKRVDWLAIGLSFLFIALTPIFSGGITMIVLGICITAIIIGVVCILFSLLFPLGGEIPSFEKAYKKSSIIWGLWHSGGRTRRNKLHIKYHALKRILLLDPCNPDFETCFDGYFDTPEQARNDIYPLTREAIGQGIEVRWYPYMQPHAFTFFNPDSDDAWVVAEEHRSGVRRDDRPKILLRAKRNQDEYNAALATYEDIWREARIPLPREYGDAEVEGNE